MAQEQVPVIGGPCQGCELVFVDMPVDLSVSSRLTPVEEPGSPLVIDGKVWRTDGTPAGDIIVYAYQTDASGTYPKGSTQHGRLRGWTKTDNAGSYRFETIRPAAYAGRNIPQHIHMHIIEPDKGTYYIDDITFDDDPLLTKGQRDKKRCRGGCGVSHPQQDGQGVWHVSRDITLGKNIPEYQ
ncbi:hypothetical protein [Shewanella sp. GXUN23E]|uniref:dioxygenase family protein n=1 Tax=Shewanella sp. GXUN23E TaxID=3422498 RepID=UPI003D7CA2BA